MAGTSPAMTELFCENRFHWASGLKIEPDSEATHCVRAELSVVERNPDKTIGAAILRQGSSPSQRAITVDANQIFKSVLLVGRAVKQHDLTIGKVERFKNMLGHQSFYHGSSN